MTSLFIIKVLSCIQGDIRNNSNGILEYCNAGTWNSICADYWTNTHATVACKQLGYSNQGQFVDYWKLISRRHSY